MFMFSPNYDVKQRDDILGNNGARFVILEFALKNAVFASNERYNGGAAICASSLSSRKREGMYKERAAN